MGGTGTVNWLYDHERNGGQAVQDTSWFRYLLNADRLLPKVAISGFLPMKTISQSKNCTPISRRLDVSHCVKGRSNERSSIMPKV